MLAVWQPGKADKVPPSGQVPEVGPRDKEAMEGGGEGLRMGGARHYGLKDW